MKKNLLFSIVVPVYNVENYLSTCLESIVNQTYPNWELILVDDGSTDRSAAICDAYQSQYLEKIKVLHQENKGLLLARRAGLSFVTGDFIWHVDADDKVSEYALETFMTRLGQTGADFLFFNFSFDEHFEKSVMHLPFSDMEIFEGAQKEKLYHLICTQVDFNPIWNKVVKRECVDFEEDYSGYQKNVQMGEDLLQVLPLITKAEKVVYVDQNLYLYRLNQDSMTKKLLSKAHYESVKLVLARFYDYVDQWNLENAEVLKLRKSILYLNERLGDVPKADFQHQDLEIKAYLKMISEDDFFRKVYQKRKLVGLTAREKVIFGLLYRQKIEALFKLYHLNQKLLLRNK